MWACLNTAAVVDFAITGVKGKSFVTTVLVLLTVLCYEFFSPQIYGTVPNGTERSRQWVAAWTKGPPKPLNLFGRDMFNTTEVRGTLPL